jgi:hypothetical protein
MALSEPEKRAADYWARQDTFLSGHPNDTGNFWDFVAEVWAARRKFVDFGPELRDDVCELIEQHHGGTRWDESKMLNALLSRASNVHEFLDRLRKKSLLHLLQPRGALDHFIVGYALAKANHAASLTELPSGLDDLASFAEDDADQFLEGVTAVSSGGDPRGVWLAATFGRRARKLSAAARDILDALNREAE